MRIILLDLNYTLVKNSYQKKHPFARQIDEEQYRAELINAIRKEFVVMITARPIQHKLLTLKSIVNKTNWLPANSYFNDTLLPPPLFKERILKKYFLPNYNTNELLAIESNPKTRAMYNKYNIRAVTFQEFLEAK